MPIAADSGAVAWRGFEEGRAVRPAVLLRAGVRSAAFAPVVTLITAAALSELTLL